VGGVALFGEGKQGSVERVRLKLMAIYQVGYHKSMRALIVCYFHYGVSWLGNFILELGYRI
jgi:hypothetical protein